LGDLLVDPGERLPDRLRVLQIEPAAQLERLRDAYQEEVVAALEHLGLTQSAALDRRVIGTLWNLSPPGLDELAATAAMLGAAGEDELVVIDSAPTGHFLRLLEMPEVALGWTRQLMRVFVKYGISGVAGGAAESLLELSRELRGLRDTLHDSARTGVIIVTLDEPMVRAETGRLEATLAGAGIRVAAVLLNRDAGTGSAPPPARGDRPGRSLAGASASRGAGAYRAGAPAAIRAPALDPPPAGAAALRGFVDTWNIVE
ncbi:MAG: hypothetical protein KFH98_04100, partial [Gemmatimonadetes bacterium]|nr:hypothetical protein [Gemmatimonadota bacterium]